ncbi:MAG: 2-C-methyl-D-erythritol 4-phosphate cytidylyltransferase [Lachnospiraceae bacterium]|nr:2-C-methyl-D-erythritol 4-phosphate cytidylyltransferase [Lachnospiraceae bacterium]
MKTAAVLLGAGSGSRMGGDVKKQYMELCGKPLMYYGIYEFENSFVDDLILVVSRGDEDYVKKEIVEKFGFQKIKAIVTGGRERYHSVWNGLQKTGNAEIILIHDLARPFVTEDMMLRAVNEATDTGAAVVGVPVKDTIRVTDRDGLGVETPNRSTLWAAQTPQVFRAALIRECYDRLHRDEEVILSQGTQITDDGQVVELFSDVRVKMVEGAYSNIKVTVPEDLAAAEVILSSRTDHRLGSGSEGAVGSTERFFGSGVR